MASIKKIKDLSKKISDKAKAKPKPKPNQRIAQGNQPPGRAGTTPRKVSDGSKASSAAATQKARQDVVKNAAIATGVLGAGTAALFNSKNKSGKTFDEAFRTARNKGEGTKFTFNGKSYTAVTKDDLKKKGYSTLAEYNRAGGKKKIDVDAAAKKIAGEVQKNKKPKTMIERIRARRKKRIGFETFKERRQARRANRRAKRANDNSSGIDKMKSGGVVSAKKSTPRGVGAAKRGFGKALR